MRLSPGYYALVSLLQEKLDPEPDEDSDIWSKAFEDCDAILRTEIPIVHLPRIIHRLKEAKKGVRHYKLIAKINEVLSALEARPGASSVADQTKLALVGGRSRRSEPSEDDLLGF